VQEQLEALYQEAQQALENVSDSDSLKSWEGKYIGRKGAITLMLRQTGQLPAEERADFGKRANEIKNLLIEAHTQRENAIRDHELAQSLEEGGIDVTLPGRPRQVGGLHPSTQIIREIQDIWAEMGFQVFRSREVESDNMNFVQLNFPPHHPARDMQDTYYTTQEDVILRTHTSPGQIRAMRTLGENGTKPIRVVLPGMCYRYEQISTRSEIQFTQIEGLAVGKGIRMSDLKGTIADFARRFYGADTDVRYRASYFPFTEPSMEVDVQCYLCGGEGCSVCKQSGWIEIMGCGMVHPNVLRNGGYDPAEYSGYAFGMGPERITMNRHLVNDIRYFWANDLRFLEQF
jgi:phenylalanyl-tRNA synthetase alpha chain